MIGAEAEVDGAHLFKAAQQKARGTSAAPGRRRVRQSPGGTQARMAAAGGAGAPAFFQGFVDTGACGGQGWNQPAQKVR